MSCKVWGNSKSFMFYKSLNDAPLQVPHGWTFIGLCLYIYLDREGLDTLYYVGRIIIGEIWDYGIWKSSNDKV